MKVGCYTLDLYCDNERDMNAPDNPHKIEGWKYAPSEQTFTGRTETACIRAARKAGWRITPKRQICPHCVAREPPKKAREVWKSPTHSVVEIDFSS